MFRTLALGVVLSALAAAPARAGNFTVVNQGSDDLVVALQYTVAPTSSGDLKVVDLGRTTTKGWFRVKRGERKTLYAGTGKTFLFHIQKDGDQSVTITPDKYEYKRNVYVADAAFEMEKPYPAGNTVQIDVVFGNNDPDEDTTGLRLRAKNGREVQYGTDEWDRLTRKVLMYEMKTNYTLNVR